MRATKAKRDVKRQRSDFVDLPHRRWDSDLMWSSARTLSQRKIPILSIYTEDADDYYSYSGQLCDALGKRRIDSAMITEKFLPDRKHLFPIKRHRDHLVNTVCEWLCEATELASGDRP